MVSVVFLLILLVPGDPVAQMLGEGASAGDLSNYRHQLGLDLPIHTQYLHYWRGVLHGDLGQSLRLHDSVTHLVLQRYPYTLALTLAALAIGVAVSIPAGRLVGPSSRPLAGTACSASSPSAACHSPTSRSAPSSSSSSPSTWAGRPSPAPVPAPSSAAASGSTLSCRAITLGSGLAGILTQHGGGTAMLEELSQDYIRTARAKGLSEHTVVYRHALANALIPVLTVVGLQFGSLLSGAVVTETVFSWPGIGRLTLSAISNRDYALVQGCILAVGLTYVAVNLLTDMAYTLVNPRMRA